MKRLAIGVFGRVQGVFFRHSTCEIAKKLNITGLARNEGDDSVYIEAEGKKENVDKFLEWCKTGPTEARVDKILVKEIELKNEKTFQIK